MHMYIYIYVCIYTYIHVHVYSDDVMMTDLWKRTSRMSHVTRSSVQIACHHYLYMNHKSSSIYTH